MFKLTSHELGNLKAVGTTQVRRPLPYQPESASEREALLKASPVTTGDEFYQGTLKISVEKLELRMPLGQDWLYCYHLKAIQR